MQVATPLFLLYHVGIVALLAMAYPPNYRPYLYAFGAIQGIVEHYSDIFPYIAFLGPILIPPAIVLLGIHYYFAYQVIANKAIVWSGLIAYLALFIYAKTQEWGFPKDTAEEQIKALHDETYVTDHFWFHNAVIGVLSITAFSLPKSGESTGKKGKKVV